ncbi:uncharacterized protein LOC26527238 [Drosophila mojavensis]|uniref:uncharacterized protein LOC26527238 n=1 Tax=Drosophila mojavensis TaxID=7230 RepID=UPI001CD18E7C|nr:uncharacterized protein LOC26527238 [Drosophila mojavensis]
MYTYTCILYKMEAHIPLILKECFKDIKIDPENNVNVTAACKKCSKPLRGSLHSTTNFLNHLKTKGHVDLLTQYEKLKFISTMKKRKHDNVGGDSPAAKSLKQIDLAVYKNSVDLDSLIVSFVVNTMSPISIVEHPSFKALLEGTQQSTARPKIMCRQTCNKQITAKYCKYLENTKETLKKVDFVCTTADIWSSSRRSYLGVTVHWIESHTFERKSATLACRRFKGTHSYDKVAELIVEIHSEFDLSPNKTFKTATDNGSNMVKAFASFGQHEDAVENPDSIKLPQDIKEDNDHDDELQLIQFPESSEEFEQWQLPNHERSAFNSITRYGEGKIVK